MSAEFENLHQILRNLYTEMLPLCGDIIGVAKGVAGLGALFYIAAKVWQALARAEPIDVYPLLRPFAIGLCIMFFPTFVLGTINTVMSPVVKGCNNILQGQTLDIEKYSQQRDKLEYEAMVRNPETAYLVSDKEFDKRIKELGWSPKSMGTMLAMQVKKAGYEMKRSIWDAFRWVMELLFQAASLILDTIRTFFLIVLSILGPLAFAISIYDGFQGTLTQWAYPVYRDLFVVAGFGLVQCCTGSYSVVDVAKRCCRTGRSELHTGYVQRCLYHIYAHWDYRLFYYSNSIKLDYTERRSRQLQQTGQFCGNERR